MTESEAEVGFWLDNLELREKQQFPISQNKRYTAKDRTHVLIPSDPIALIKSNFFCKFKASYTFGAIPMEEKNPTKDGWFVGKLNDKYHGFVTESERAFHC